MFIKAHFPKPNTFLLLWLINNTPAWAVFVDVPMRTDTSYLGTAGGYLALSDNTTGSSNTGFGDGALQQNTTGGANTAVGSGALYRNITGDYNTASGANALASNNSGINNTANGSLALFSNNGNSNTASGFESLYRNTIGGENTAIGALALRSNTTGGYNTAAGSTALMNNTIGTHNTANGAFSLRDNSTGTFNTADGGWALRLNTTGSSNLASGYSALRNSTTGSQNTALGAWSLSVNAAAANNNTALGFQALKNKAAGNGNLALGMNAGLNLVSGNSNVYIANAGAANESATIRIGVPGHAKTFIGGISGKTTGLATAVPVLIDANGQLGTIKSSARYKQDIANMKEASQGLLKLRPVTFRYKDSYEDGGKPLEYGLIAEEVAKVYPDLVAYGADGKIETVQYQKLTPMLLNEVIRLHAANQSDQVKIASQSEELTILKKQIVEQHDQAMTEINRLKAQIISLETRSASIEALINRLARLEAEQMLGRAN